MLWQRKFGCWGLSNNKIINMSIKTTSLVCIVLSKAHKLTSVTWCCFLLHLRFQWSDTGRNSRNAIDAWTIWAFDSRNHVALYSLIHTPSSCAGQCHLQQSSDSTDSNTIQRLIYGFSNIWVGVCLKSRGPRIQLIYLKTQATWGALAVT